jgi:glycosyltransferase involved in cell wall biosynthesis
MLIGVDARELEGKPTGVGMYLRNILDRISLPPGGRLLLYFRNRIPENLPAHGEPVLLRAGGGNLLWQQWSLCRDLNRRKVRLFFSPANAVPWNYSGVNVMTIHDLSFFRYPQWFSFKERISRRLNTGRSIHKADRIYAVSPFAREELISRFNLDSTTVLVTPNGVAPHPADPERRTALRRTHGLQDSRLILFVGSIFNRRHVPLLIEATATLDASFRLVIIGENRTHPRQDLNALAVRLGLERRISILDYASDSTVDEHYRMADLFVYLSEYEGFGIPPLEAMSYDVPCVLSSTPHMDRIFQDAAHFAKALTVEEVSKSIERCMQDSVERERLKQAGRTLVQHYSWDETARIISEDWARLLYNSKV